MHKYQSEICCFSLEAVNIAKAAGADRVELCVNRILGGTTPDNEMIEKAVETGIPVYVIIRPRGGNFIYNSSETELILQQIQVAKSLGAKGIVAGALNELQEIDQEKTKLFLLASSGCDFTFHRAFDETLQPVEALQDLIHIGVKRVLTSGTKKDAKRGISILKTLVENAQHRISVMAGGGVDSTLLNELKNIGVHEFHGSLIKDAGNIPDDSEISDFVTLVKQFNRQ